MNLPPVRFRQLLYCLAYISIIIAATPAIIVWWYKLIFWTFALFLYWVFLFICKERSWIFPFARFGEAPLGYDTGIYLRSFALYLSDPQEGLRPLALIIQLLNAIGLSQNTILHGFYVAINILVGLGVYMLGRAIFRKQLIAVCAFLIFTISISQFEAYHWMFYRMMVSLFLLLVTSALILRRSSLAALTGGFGLALHPATFLVFAFAYFIYFVAIGVSNFVLHSRQGMRLGYLVAMGLSMLMIALLVNFPEIYTELPTLTEHRLQVGSFSPFLSNELTGLYLNFTAFRLSVLSYLPFALLGILLMLYENIFLNSRNILSHQKIFALIGLLLSFVLIFLRVIFYQRYLIILDIFIIIFAAYALAHFFEYFSVKKSGQIFIAIMVAGFCSIIVFYGATREPWIKPSELQELKQVSLRIEPDALGMATHAYYTPWVYGYLAPETIAPGYFIDRWSLTEWNIFWKTNNDEERVRLLARYDKRPIYIYIGTRQEPSQRLVIAFLDKNAEKITEHIWRYQTTPLF